MLSNLMPVGIKAVNTPSKNNDIQGFKAVNDKISHAVGDGYEHTDARTRC